MPRSVNAATKFLIVKLMTEGKDGVPLGQREIERETGVSRQYIRRLARNLGHQFPRNGIEIVGKICMCANCGAFFKKPPSKIKRAKNQFCDIYCKEAFFKGINHPNWKHGKNVETFSTWIKNQASYDTWRQSVLERDGNQCVISGRTDNLQAHHIFQKAENFSPEKSLDPSNGITLNFEVHVEIHDLIRKGVGFEEAIEVLKKKYNKVD
jgi:hypothetical protein